MSVSLTCPHCAATLSVSDANLTVRASCDPCAKKFRLTRKQIGFRRPKDCPHCKRPLKVNWSKGWQLKCSNCEKSLSVSAEDLAAANAQVETAPDSTTKLLLLILGILAPVFIAAFAGWSHFLVPWLIAATFLALATVFGVRGIRCHRGAQRTSATAVRKISELKEGVCSTVGRVKALEPPMRSPLSNTDCVYCHHIVEQKKRDEFEVLKDTERQSPFRIEDETGSTTVSLDGAQLRLQYKTMNSGDKREREQVIPVGSEIIVLGNVVIGENNVPSFEAGDDELIITDSLEGLAQGQSKEGKTSLIAAAVMVAIGLLSPFVVPDDVFRVFAYSPQQIPASLRFARRFTGPFQSRPLPPRPVRRHKERRKLSSRVLPYFGVVDKTTSGLSRYEQDVVFTFDDCRTAVWTHDSGTNYVDFFTFTNAVLGQPPITEAREVTFGVNLDDIWLNVHISPA